MRGKAHATAGPTSIRAKRKERKRQEILRAGLKVFAGKGFQGATMDDIAIELEATKGLLYYHFKTKEDILNAILSENQMIAGIEAGIASLTGLPAAQALKLGVHNSVALMEANSGLVRFLHVQSLLSGSQAESVYSKVLERLYQIVVRGIEHFQRVGEIKADLDSRVWARLVVDLVMSYFLQRQIFGERQQTPANYLDRALEILLHGIAVDHESAELADAQAARTEKISRKIPR
ncbi:MAG: TetR/AcrR family transcriptional regulator [Candidatus Binataceae bacterium]